MAKRKPARKTNAQLRAEINKIKKLKVDAENRKKIFAERKKELEELRKLKAEVRSLKGAGSNREVARKVAGRLGKQAGSASWKGLKAVGKVVKAKLEAEAKAQARENARIRKRK